MARKMKDTQKYIAYVINKEMDYTIIKIANLMGYAQSTISVAVRNVSYRKIHKDIELDLNKAREKIKQGYENKEYEVTG